MKKKHVDEGKAGEMGFWRGVRSIIGKSVLLLCLAVLANSSRAEVRLAGIFGSNMVLQSEKTVPVWGWAAPDENVTVTFAGQTRSAKAGSDGRWRVTLDSMPPSDEAREMVVSGTVSTNELKVGNVLVGEVWVGSGQSNMDWWLGGTSGGTAEIAAAKRPSLRYFNVEMGGWPQPKDDVEGKWEVCTPSTAGACSAVLYYFGRDLQQETHRPVGLIRASRGGTVIQWWMRWEVLITDPEARREAEARVKQLDDPAWVARTEVSEAAKYEQELANAKAEHRQPRMGKPQPYGKTYAGRPSCLFNAMIHPLLGLSIRGLVWYQAEFNNGHHELYTRLFPKMIRDWREQWGLGDIPFLFVQLPGNDSPQVEPWSKAQRGRSWAELREAQMSGLTEPNTAMAVTIDTAPEGDLHPKNKQPVGTRLALLATRLVYGHDVACFAPVFQSMTVEGKAIRIRLSHAEGGLVAKDGGSVKGFIIAGADHNFVWADARVEGDSVVASSDQVATPMAVRYAWADNPLISLYNKAGLPLAPFRTDDWK